MYFKAVLSALVTNQIVGRADAKAILKKLIEPLFSEAVRRMVAAFEGRAKKLYGAPDSGRPNQ